MWYNIKVVGTKATWWYDADIAQLVEHVIGNDEVISSNLIISSKKPEVNLGFFVIFRNSEKVWAVFKTAHFLFTIFHRPDR